MVGVEAVAWAYALNYALYSLVMYVCVYTRLDGYFSKEVEVAVEKTI